MSEKIERQGKSSPTRVGLAYEGFTVDSSVTWKEGQSSHNKAGSRWQEVKEGEIRET